jgi:ariadne-1
LESFVSNNKKLRWCPGPNCENIIEVLGLAEVDVNCKCRLTFCFNCENETHTPATCDMFAKWTDRMKLEGEANNWIAHNTKACPRCKVLTQKDTGCNHMTCS